ncbi:MAG: hypothetical protein ACLFN8_02810 [Candidatus Woesearchaeota archaeon]
MATKLKQKLNQIQKSIKTYNSAVAEDPSQNELKFMSFLPGTIAGINAALTNTISQDSQILTYIVAGTTQIAATLGNYLVQQQHDIKKMTTQIKQYEDLDIKENI